MAKINKVMVGEALVGDGNEVAHIDLIIGPRGSPAETAFCNGLINNKHGFTSLLAVIAPNLPCKPNTLMFNKVTINDARQAVQMFGPAQHGVAKAVQDAVAEGIIPADEADDVYVLVGVFIHWEGGRRRQDPAVQLRGHEAVDPARGQRRAEGCRRHRAAQLGQAPLRRQRLDRGRPWAERTSARTAGSAPAAGFDLPRPVTVEKRDMPSFAQGRRDPGGAPPGAYLGWADGPDGSRLNGTARAVPFFRFGASLPGLASVPISWLRPRAEPTGPAPRRPKPRVGLNPAPNPVAPMPKPLIVDIPHDLGQAEAKRRLSEGTEQVRALLMKSGIAVDQLAWTGDRLDFGVSAVAQKVAGTIDVGQESVRLEVRLPFLLALFAEKIQKVASKEGTLLLTKK